MSIKLNVWIEIEGKNIHAGRLIGENTADTTFVYENSYLQHPKVRAISVSLPLQASPFSPERTRIFFDGLLPEGYTRRCVAAEMRVAEDDYISILKNLGKECLGAIQILDDNDDETPSISYSEMTEDQMYLFAKEGAMESASLVTKSHLSLTGASGKTGLYYDEKNNKWFLPTGSAPSTHIVKQSHVRLDQIVTNEQLCLLTAKQLGIAVPDSFIIRFADNEDDNVLFATKRYDRKQGFREFDGLNIPYRLHQEDFSQALGIPAERKYEKGDENYFAQMMGLLRRYAANPMQAQRALWQIAVYNYLIGNTDNHIKNISLLYSEDLSSMGLSPAYDIICTLIYESSTDEMALAINGKTSIYDISREDFEMEAQKSGLGIALFMREFDRLDYLLEECLEKSAEELYNLGFENAADMKDRILKSRRRRKYS